jgi:hypothetical protein
MPCRDPASINRVRQQRNPPPLSYLRTGRRYTALAMLQRFGLQLVSTVAGRYGDICSFVIVQGPKGELACTRINRAHRKPSRWQRPDRAQSRTRSSRRCRGTRGCVGEADRVHASARVGWQGAREEGVRAYPARFVPPRMPAGSLGLSSAELARASLFIARLCRCTPGRLGMPRATRKRTSAPGPPTSAPGPPTSAPGPVRSQDPMGRSASARAGARCPRLRQVKSARLASVESPWMHLGRPSASATPRAHELASVCCNLDRSQHRSPVCSV